jgi:hypothetical protein
MKCTKWQVPRLFQISDYLILLKILLLSSLIFILLRHHLINKLNALE